MGATCHPPEECVIRDSKWISSSGEEEREECKRFYFHWGEMLWPRPLSEDEKTAC